MEPIVEKKEQDQQQVKQNEDQQLKEEDLLLTLKDDKKNRVIRIKSTAGHQVRLDLKNKKLFYHHPKIDKEFGNLRKTNFLKDFQTVLFK
jgi:urease accessory protein UreE